MARIPNGSLSAWVGPVIAYHPRMLRPLLLLGTASILLLACDDLDAVCTEIGCANAFALTVEESGGGTALVVTATVTGPNQSEARLTCVPTSGGTASSTVTGNFNTWSSFCMGDRIEIGSDSVRLESVQVELETASGARFSGTVPLTVVTSRPNGEGCDPECWRGEATITAMP
ncbi:MAG: hypothetical protein AAFU79_37235 [Myxococcota bacterium]